MSAEAVSRDAESQAGAAGGRLSDELLACLVPLAEGPAGEDPRHGDRFVQVQAEVSRLAGTDFEIMAEGCRAILREEAKDLRIAGYLALAATAREGIRGLAATLELSAALIERFGSDLHPRRPAARKSALLFLASDRITALIARAPDAGDSSAREELAAAIEVLRERVTETLGIGDFRLSDLSAWLRRHIAEAPSQSPIKRPDNAAIASPAAASLALEKPADDSELHAGTRRLLAYLRENERWAEHVALSRAYRWAALAAPPAQGGTTRVTPPRSAGLAALDAACAEQRWDDGLAGAERAFLESGGQFSFRIQRLGAHCARQGEHAALAERIESEVLLLCRRLPALDTLCYSDDTPFAEEVDRSWLDRLAATRDDSRSETAQSAEDQLAKAREALTDDGLATALRELEAKAADGGRDFAHARVLQARLCLEAERADIARPVLEGVLERLRREGHDLWDRKLTIQALQLLLQATNRDTGQSRNDRNRRQAQVREQLARLDISAALAHAGGANDTAT